MLELIIIAVLAYFFKDLILDAFKALNRAKTPATKTINAVVTVSNVLINRGLVEFYDISDFDATTLTEEDYAELTLGTSASMVINKRWSVITDAVALLITKLSKTDKSLLTTEDIFSIYNGRDVTAVITDRKTIIADATI